MQIVASTLESGCLRIACAGPFGVGSQGNPSGRRLQHTLEAALEQPDADVSQLVIDFTDVRYEWGDGPAWSVLPAVKRGLKVIYLARGPVRQALESLFQATGYDRLGAITVAEAYDASGPGQPVSP